MYTRVLHQFLQLRIEMVIYREASECGYLEKLKGGYTRHGDGDSPRPLGYIIDVSIIRGVGMAHRMLHLLTSFSPSSHFQLHLSRLLPVVHRLSFKWIGTAGTTRSEEFQ